MSLANRITLGRLVLALVLFVLLAVADVAQEAVAGWLIAGMALFILVVATDALDGYYARKLNQTSDFGRLADPAVDKVVVCGTLIFLCAADWARPVLAPWMVVLIVAREFAINGLRGFVESRGIRFGADKAGKLKMIVQSVAIPAVFFQAIVQRLAQGAGWFCDAAYWLAVVLVWAALVLTVWSGLEYVGKASRILRVRA